MRIFLLLSVSCALKLSDPAILRESDASNVSLKSWCIRIGCAQPFTPSGCSSWCAWTDDKMADSIARGALPVIPAQLFNIMIMSGDSCIPGANNIPTAFFFRGRFGTAEFGRAVYPGGDGETKLKTTELNCGQCYLIGGDSACNGESHCECPDGVSHTCAAPTRGPAPARQLITAGGTVFYGLKVQANTAGDANELVFF